MPVTRYYHDAVRTTPEAYEPSTEQSTAFPWGTLNTNGDTTDYVGLTPTRQNNSALLTFNSINQTGRQSKFLYQASYRLAAQTIPAGTWQFAADASEFNAAANSFFGFAVYIWRPGTSTKVATIYDTQANVGTEWPTTVAARIVSFSGSSVTTENEDVLIVEIWHTSQQGMATAYAHTVNWRSSPDTDVTTNGETTGNGGWLDAPELLTPYSPPSSPYTFSFILD